MATLNYVVKTRETARAVAYRFGSDPGALSAHFVIDKNTHTVTAASGTWQASAERTAGWILFQMRKRGGSDWLPHGTIAS